MFNVLYQTTKCKLQTVLSRLHAWA